MAGKGSKLLILLIVAIVLAFGAAGTAVVFNTELARHQEKLLKLKKEEMILKGSKNQRGQKAIMMDDVMALRKFIVGKEDDVLDVDQLKREYLQKAKERAEQYFKGKKKGKQYNTLIEIYPDLFSEIIILRDQVRGFQDDTQKVRLDLDKKRGSYSHLKNISDQEIDKLRSEKESDQTRLTRVIQEREDERDDYKRKYEESNRQKELLRDNYEQVVIPKLKTEIANLTRKIQKLKETIRRRKKIEDLEHDGEVITANQNLGYVWLNMGRIHGLQKGLIFKVFQYIKGGKRNFKGKVEVIRVDVDMAQARILEQTYSNDPLIKGDYVISPIFERNQKKTFVFAGQKAMHRLYSPEKYKALLQGQNQAVEDQVGNRTDFIILLEKYEQTKEYEDAKNFPWIIFLREEDLLEYLRK